MAIDPNIPLQSRAPQFDSPFESAGRFMQLQGMVQRQKLGEMQMEDAVRVRDEREAVKTAFQETGGDLAKTADALQAKGLFEPALKVRHSMAEQAKALQEAQKVRLEVMQKRKDLQRTLIVGGASDPTEAGLARVAQELVQNGLMDEESARRFHSEVSSLGSPQAIQRKLVEFARTPENFVALYTPKFETIDNGQTKTIRDVNPNSNPGALAPVQMLQTPGQIQSAQDAAASRRLTAAGQEETRRHNKFNEQNPLLSTVETADGVFQVPNRGGVGRPVMDAAGKPLSGKPPTESQSTAALYAVRAAEADKIINGMAAGGTTMPGIIKGAAEGVPLVGNALGALVGVTPGVKPTAEQQQVEQAQRNFINAVLRKESGAAIGAGEFDSAKKQYFPQIGDSPEVIAQKAQTRQDAIAGLTQAGGGAVERVQALRPAPAEVTPVAPQAPRESFTPPPDSARTKSGRVGEAPKSTPGAFTESKVAKMPMPRDVPVGAEIETPDGKVLVNDGTSWKPKR